jgi:hypothetical protein
MEPSVRLDGDRKEASSMKDVQVSRVVLGNLLPISQIRRESWLRMGTFVDVGLGRRKGHLNVTEEVYIGRKVFEFLYTLNVRITDNYISSSRALT